MKNITLLLTLLISLNLFSQESYPHKRPQLMLGKQVKVLPMHENLLKIYNGGYYEKFYSDPDMRNVYKKKPGKQQSEYNALAGRTFTVISVDKEKETGNYDEKDLYYAYKLEDTATKEIVYYKFLPYFDRTKPYYLEVIGGLDLPADFYCDYIETMVLTEKSVHYTLDIPYRCELDKHFYDGKVSYQLTLQIDSVNFPGKGYTVTLDNGSVIACSGICTIGENISQRRIAIRDLTEKEMKLLSQYKIISFTIQGADYKLSAREMTMMQEGAKCLLTK